MDQLLYLLVKESGDVFKIGVSVDPQKRSRVLPQRLDFGKSLQICFSNAKAVDVERSLHKFFCEHHKPFAHGDGKTEWFDIVALPLVVKFLEVNSTFFGCDIAPLKCHIRQQKLARPVAVLSHEELPLASYWAAHQHNMTVFEGLSLWVEGVTKHSSFVRFIHKPSKAGTKALWQGTHPMFPEVDRGIDPVPEIVVAEFSMYHPDSKKIKEIPPPAQFNYFMTFPRYGNLAVFSYDIENERDLLFVTFNLGILRREDGPYRNELVELLEKLGQSQQN